MKLFGSDLNKRDVLRYCGSSKQLMGIGLSEGLEGKEKGVRTALVRSGAGLSFSVIIDRALDIANCEYKGYPVAWISKTGITGPAFYDPREAEIHRSFFGGLLTTCGLTNAGPSNDYNNSYEGQHGRISNTPASLFSCRQEWVDEEFIMELSGKNVQATLFGENLEMRRTIRCMGGSNKFEIETEVENLGFTSEPFMYLMHMNFGFPLLSGSSKLFISAEEILPRDEEGRKGFEDFNNFTLPKAGYKEQVFFVKPSADKNGKAIVLLKNSLPNDTELGVIIRYSIRELNSLTFWKMLGEGEYVLGIEPGNCYPLGRKEAAKRGHLEFIQPAEIRRFSVSVEVTDEKKQINEVMKEINYLGTGSGAN